MAAVPSPGGVGWNSDEVAYSTVGRTKVEYGPGGPIPPYAACASRLALAICCGMLIGTAAAADSFQDGYRQGFQDGYRQGFEDGSRRWPGAGPAGAPPPGIPAAPASAPLHAIRVTQADYGDGYSDCSATAAVARLLDGRRGGSVRAGNELCGDPAPGRRKTLRVLYFCGGQEREATAPQNEMLSLRCD